MTTPLSLLRQYSSVLRELRKSGVLRSANNPVADYAELLVSRALALDLSGKSNAGYDAVDNAGARYEIKGRRVTPENPSRQLSAIRGIDKRKFDYLAGVLFDVEFNVLKACLVPHRVVNENCQFSRHSNSSIFHLRDSVWQLQGVENLTEVVQLAQKELEASPVAVAR